MLIGGSILTVGAAVLGPSACAMRGMKQGSAVAAGGNAPEKPQGTPIPARDEDIGPVLARLDAWYAAHLTNENYRLEPPASVAELDALEALTGQQLSRAYRQLYAWMGGENDDRWGHIYGLPLLTQERVRAEWQTMRKVEQYFGGNRYPVPGGGWPVGAVDPAYTNPGWIPLTADGSGNCIGLDLAPWPRGQTGQIILFGRDEDVKVVLSPSLGGFLDWIATLLESGNFRLDIAPGEQVLREFRLEDPPVDHFHEGARQLLGAPGQYL